MVKRKFVYFALMVLVFGRLLYSLAVDVLFYSRAYFDRGLAVSSTTRGIITSGLWMRENLILSIVFALVLVVLIALLGEKVFRRNSHYFYMAITVVSAFGVIVLYTALRAPLR